MRRPNPPTETRDIYLSVEVQGRHVVKPPVEALERTVLPWLLGQNWSRSGDLRFALQVDCYGPKLCGGFLGVRVICQPMYNPSSVELRVQPPGDDYHWKCHLVCENPSVADEIVRRERPAASAYVSALMDAVDADEPDLNTAPDIVGRRIRRYNRRVSHERRCVKILTDRAVRRRLCYGLQSELVDGQLTVAAVEKQLAAVGCRTQHLNALRTAMIELVDDCLLDPVELPTGEQFVPTLLFEEYAVAHAVELRKKEVARLEGRRQTQSKLLEAAQRDYERIMEQATRLQERIRGLTAEVASIDEQLELNKVS